MRLWIPSRPLLSFIRGASFSSSAVAIAEPAPARPSTANQRAAHTAHSARTQSAQQRRLRSMHGGSRRRASQVSYRNTTVVVAEAEIETDEAAIAPTASASVAVVSAAKATTATASSAKSADATLKRRVWGLALPAIGEQLLALGVGLSDTFLSGHLSDHAIKTLGYDRATAVASVGVASTAVWVIITVFFGVNLGVTALVARATGARDGKLAARTVGQGVWLSALIGLVMIGLAVPLAQVITALLGVTGKEAELAAQYIRVYSLTLPATGIASAMTAAMRGAGDARRPLLVMLVVNGANIIASWTLMNGIPALGIQPIGVIGSAIGAATGWTFGCLLATILITRSHPRAPRLTLAALRPDFGTAGRVMRVGLPSAAELVVFQVGVLTFSRVVVGLGPVPYAANVTINTADSIGTLPGFGFAGAATALVGQALGARDPRLAERSVWASLRPALVVTLCVGACEAIFPQVLLGLFVADPQVLAAGDIAMRLSLLTLPASGMGFVLNGALRGAGDTRFPVLVRATGTWGLRLPLAMLLIPLWGLPGARLSMAADFWIQTALSCWRFKSGRWRTTHV